MVILNVMFNVHDDGPSLNQQRVFDWKMSSTSVHMHCVDVYFSCAVDCILMTLYQLRAAAVNHYETLVT